MENLKDELENYRLRKRRLEKVKNFKDNVLVFFKCGINDKHYSEGKDYMSNPVTISVDTEVVRDCVLPSEEELTQMSSEGDFDDTKNFYLKYTLQMVCLAFWVTLYVIAVELQFGSAFLMLSGLAGIYLNTRTDPKKPNEISAYSVFNKNCESIGGTLKAEQLEYEMGIR